MSSGDDASDAVSDDASDTAATLQQKLQAAVHLAEDLPSTTPSQVASPATLRANRDLITQLQERMIQAGQLEPVSISDELESVALHLGGIAGPTAPQPLPPAIRESAESAMASIKRAIRKRVSDEDIDTLFEEMDSAVNAISTPTSSQPRDPAIMERTKKAYDDLTADMRRKQIIASRTRAPSKKKVRALAKISRAHL